MIKCSIIECLDSSPELNRPANFGGPSGFGPSSTCEVTDLFANEVDRKEPEIDPIEPEMDPFAPDLEPTEPETDPMEPAVDPIAPEEDPFGPDPWSREQNTCDSPQRIQLTPGEYIPDAIASDAHVDGLYGDDWCEAWTVTTDGSDEQVTRYTF